MSVDYGPSGAALGFPYTPPQGGGGGAVALAGDVTGTTAASVVSELQGEVLTITGPIAAGEVLASDAGGTALVNADIATVLGYDPVANLSALGIPDPTVQQYGSVLQVVGGVAAWPNQLDQFASATGWTLVDSSNPANGEASITGGVARLEAVAGVSQSWDGSGGYNGPSMRVALASRSITNPRSMRVRLRIVSMTAVTQAYTHLAIGTDATTPRYTVWVRGNGQVSANFIATATDLGATLTAGSAQLDGNDWVELAVRGQCVAFRFGRGAGGAAPLTWTELWGLTAADGQLFTHAMIGLASFTPPSPVTVDHDDFTTIQLP